MPWSVWFESVDRSNTHRILIRSKCNSEITAIRQQKRRITFDRRVHLVQKRAVHDSHHKFLVDRQSDADAAERKLMIEVHGSVYRINDPGRIVGPFHLFGGRLFADESMCRISCSQFAVHERFDRFVRLGHQIGKACLLLHFRVAPTGLRHHQTGRVRQIDRQIQILTQSIDIYLMVRCHRDWKYSAISNNFRQMQKHNQTWTTKQKLTLTFTTIN